jgi:iron complex outermembrane receptor protein
MSKSNRCLLGLLSISALFLADVAVATAMQQQADDAVEFSLEELLELEVSTVYGASLYAQEVSEAPSSVSVVTSDDIEKYGYRTLADILSGVRGFFTTYDRNYAYVATRGFGLPGDYNSRVLVLVDGHRVNENVYDGAGVGTGFNVDVDMIERVEVIRGPSSSIYGSNAFFGVVNVITKGAKYFDGIEVSGEAMSFGGVRTRATYGSSFDNGLEAVFSGTVYDSDGPSSLFFEEFDDPETNNGVFVDGDDDRSYNLFSSVSFKDFTVQGAFVSREKGIPTGAWEIQFNDNRSRTRDDLTYVDLSYNHDFASAVNLSARIGYDRYDYDGDYVYDYAEEEDEEPYIVINKDDAFGEWITSEARISKQWSSHRGLAGVLYRKNTHQDQGNFDEEVYLEDERDSSNWAVFVQDEIQASNKLMLNMGVRHDHSTLYDGGSTNPRFAAIFTADDRTTLKFLYGQAFRAPAAYELFYHDGFSSQKPALSLDPEDVETYEGVLERYFGENFSGTIAGYFYKIDNLIIQDTDLDDELIVFRNLGQVQGKGLELELRGRWQDGLETEVSYALQETEDDDTGEELTNSPRHMFKARAKLPLLQRKLFAGIETTFMGERITLAGDRTDTFSATNLTLYSRDFVPGMEFSASFYNVFDQSNTHPGAEEHLQDMIHLDGRTYRFNLTFNH